MVSLHEAFPDGDSSFISTGEVASIYPLSSVFVSPLIVIETSLPSVAQLKLKVPATTGDIVIVALAELPPQDVFPFTVITPLDIVELPPPESSSTEICTPLISSVSATISIGLLTFSIAL